MKCPKSKTECTSCKSVHGAPFCDKEDAYISNFDKCSKDK